jgi:hypothetical protein
MTIYDAGAVSALQILVEQGNLEITINGGKIQAIRDSFLSGDAATTTKTLTTVPTTEEGAHNHTKDAKCASWMNTRVSRKARCLGASLALPLPAEPSDRSDTYGRPKCIRVCKPGCYWQESVWMVPDFLCCKISYGMKDTVVTPSGVTYERAVISEHLRRVVYFDPLTRAPLMESQLVPNITVREVIRDFCEHNSWVEVEGSVVFLCIGTTITSSTIQGCAHTQQAHAELRWLLAVIVLGNIGQRGVTSLEDWELAR